MQTSADFSQERDELQRVLASGIFHRAPNLAQLLTYVCARYFEGAGDQIKEYNIAIDALRRPPDFDQKRDSIVRVEAHRLRKRLREYYEGAGADHPIRIEIPSGQYAPQFLANPAPASRVLPDARGEDQDPGFESLALERRPRALEPGELSAVPQWRPPRAWMMLSVLLLVLGAAAVAAWRAPSWTGRRVETRTGLTGAVPGGSEEVRILAGHLGSDYTDRMGRVWLSDRYYQGGRVVASLDHPIFGTREPRMYQIRREGAFEYAIPLDMGVYELRLHFAETVYGDYNVAGGGESSRVFNVYLNDRKILDEFDIIGEVGPSTADIRAFKDVSPGPDGFLRLRFEAFTNAPLLCAIEITPGVSGLMKPIRMVAQDRPYTDSHGRMWEPDRYARGGQLVARNKPVGNAPDPELFRGERFGNLRYVVPVPPGRYGVTIHAAEAWFGPGTPVGGGPGSRLFDITVNGAVLRRGFDIYKEARGAGRAVEFAAHGLEPDARGKLVIALEPTRNYACVNALEIVDESR